MYNINPNNENNAYEISYSYFQGYNGIFSLSANITRNLKK